MGNPGEHPAVILICGVIAEASLLAEVNDQLTRRYGAVAQASALIPFTFTDYYTAEMGADLTRQFLVFRRRVAATELPDIKLTTNQIERMLARPDGRRQANIDPGYLTAAKVVLATTKDFQHRLYLDKGIYAEVTLRFRGGSFVPWEWTYPDYRSPAVRDFFTMARNSALQRERDAAR